MIEELFTYTQKEPLFIIPTERLFKKWHFLNCYKNFQNVINKMNLHSDMEQEILLKGHELYYNGALNIKVIESNNCEKSILIY